MKICRACLSSSKVDDMINIDNKCIENYYILTNLNISEEDGMPQEFCMDCWLLVIKFVEFRDKCISSESTLREAIKADVKIETKEESDCIKDEDSIIKEEPLDIQDAEELDAETLFDKCFASSSQYDSDYSDNEKRKKTLLRKSKRVKNVKKSKKIQNEKESDLTIDVKIEPEVPFQKENVIVGVNDETITCGLCPETFEDKSLLLVHLDCHKDDLNCQYCFESYVDRPHILSHRLCHLPLGKANCPFCWKRFRRDFYLEYHIRKLHCDDEYQGLKCKICLKNYDKPRSLIRHINRSHRNAKIFGCTICTKLFRTTQLLKSHMRVHSTEKKFVCDLCGFSCKYPGSLQEHKLRKHSIEKHQCVSCTRLFPRKELLLDHRCTSLMCAVCGKEFKQSNAYSRHIRSHTDECKYKCTRCPAKYKTREALKVHNDRHDGNRTKECEFCHMKFYSYPVLLKHRRIHTGDKPYVCKICFKGFTGGHNLKVHMKVHGEMLVVKRDQESVKKE